MPFETFHRQRQRPSDEPFVTIQKKGVLSLNLAAFNALDSPEAVELLFDREEQRMGIRKTSPSVEHSYTVRGLGRAKVDTNWLISGTAFVQYYGIKAETARRWKAEVEHGESLVDAPMLVIDLKEPGTEVIGNRRRNRQESATTAVT